MKSNRHRVLRCRDGLEPCAAPGDRERREVVVELSGEAELAMGVTNCDKVNVADRFYLRDEAEEIGHNRSMVTNNVGRVSEFIDEHQVMQGPVTVMSPEVREL